MTKIFGIKDFQQSERLRKAEEIYPGAAEALASSFIKAVRYEPSGRIQSEEPNDCGEPQGKAGKKEEKLKDHVIAHQEKKHLQLLLEDETLPTVTPLFARLVTDGEAIILELKTPNRPFYWSVARLEISPKGQVVMYREPSIDDPLVNTDGKGRIQN